jgi:outer membrane protein TolC
MNTSLNLLTRAAWSIALALGGAAHAAEALLDMPQAQALAVAQQPLLDEIDAQVRAARQAAVAVSQLPDPQLIGGVRDLPVTSRDAFSFTDDTDTQIVVGIAQEFPRAAKRRLRGAQRLREADRLEVERMRQQRTVIRDAGLAWLAVWREVCATALARATQDEVDLQMQALAIAVAAGKASQSDLIEAQLAVDRARDEVAAREQGVARARAAMHRWIGAAAEGPIAPELPHPSALPSLAALLAGIAEHPELRVLHARVDEAAVDVDLAHAAYSPDWRVEVAYGNRADYSDMVMLQVGMDLPLFTRNRQDRGLASALALGEAAQQQQDDGLRRLRAEVTSVYGDVQRFEQRVAYYSDTIVPRSTANVDAALAAWRSGSGSFRQVIDARRTQLDVALAHLDLRRDLTSARLALAYLSTTEE